MSNKFTDIFKMLGKFNKVTRIIDEAKLEFLQAKADDGKVDAEEMLGILTGAMEALLSSGVLTSTPDPKPIVETDILAP